MILRNLLKDFNCCEKKLGLDSVSRYKWLKSKNIDWRLKNEK